jgi:hypothetical protein
MNKPNRFITRMALFISVAIGVTALLVAPLVEAFTSNPPLNSLIVGVLLLGVVYCFRQVTQLAPEVRWIETFRTNRPGLSTQTAPKLLSPTARMLSERKGKVMLSAVAMRSLLDGIGARLDESREISRYLIGLLIFLGLLGTFWGLLDTVSSVSRLIGNLSVADSDIVQTFTNLKDGLSDPLNGMGTAFSSSLFGLSGALILGFLDLQAGQAQNQFYNDLEEWLSSVTRLSSGSTLGDNEQSVPAYVQALLEQTAESLGNLQTTLSRSEEDRRLTNSNILQLAERLAAVGDQLQRANGGMDEASRGHLRNLEMYSGRMVEEMTIGRDQILAQIRSEIKLLARTIAATAEQPKDPN